MPDRRVLGLSRAGCERSHHRLARIDADSHFERSIAGLAQARGVAPHLLLHPHGGVERALRMVLVGERRAEQRENSVAGGLHDIAVIPMDRIHHQLERRIHNRARLLGVKVFHQLHRALDVREQRRDCLALALGYFDSWFFTGDASRWHR